MLCNAKSRTNEGDVGGVNGLGVRRLIPDRNYEEID